MSLQGESVDDLCDPDMVEELDMLRKKTEEQNSRYRRNAVPLKRPPSIGHQHSRDDTKPSPQIRRR